jgi:hypothetical protein
MPFSLSQRHVDLIGLQPGEAVSQKENCGLGQIEDIDLRLLLCDRSSPVAQKLTLLNKNSKPTSNGNSGLVGNRPFKRPKS